MESLEKKSSVLNLELECFRNKYNQNNLTGSSLKTDIPSANESFVKRLAKIPLSSAPRKCSKVCEKLFASGIEDSDSILMSVSSINENPQDKNPQENRESVTNSAFDCSVEVSYVFNRKELEQNNVGGRHFDILFSFLNSWIREA